MTVLSFNYATLKDQEAFQEYVQKAAALMKMAGIDVVIRAKFSKTLLGTPKTDHVSAVFRYPDLDVAKAFYVSEPYKKIVPLRDKACEMSIHFYSE